MNDFHQTDQASTGIYTPTLKLGNVVQMRNRTKPLQTHIRQATACPVADAPVEHKTENPFNELPNIGRIGYGMSAGIVAAVTAVAAIPLPVHVCTILSPHTVLDE